MVQPEKRPGINGGGFATAALLAPGIATTICLLGLVGTSPSGGFGEVGRLIGSWLFLLVIVSAWGLLPSLIFGGLVLIIILRFWPERPHRLVFVAGGVVAAGLYVLAGLWVAELSPGAAMFFAPWAAPNFLGGDQGGSSPVNWWLLASLLLAGAGAGLIYAAITKRG